MLAAVCSFAACVLGAAAEPLDSAGRSPGFPRGVQRKVVEGDGYPSTLHDCGDGWFSQTECSDGDIDTKKVCEAHGYTGIDKYGGNSGNLCSQSNDGNGHCEWGSKSCGCTVDFHCTGKTKAPTSAPTPAPTLAPTTSAECEASEDEVAIKEAEVKLKEAELAEAQHKAERTCGVQAARMSPALLARKASSFQWPGSSVGYVLVAASSSAVTWVVSRASTLRRNGYRQQLLAP